LLDVEQAAHYLNRTVNSVRHLAATEKIPSVRLDDRVFFDVEDLNRTIEASKRRPAKPARNRVK
jgi:hypothetical protein